MKKTNQEYIKKLGSEEWVEVPTYWLLELLRISKMTQTKKGKEWLDLLYGYISTVETIIKYAKKHK